MNASKNVLLIFTLTIYLVFFIPFSTFSQDLSGTFIMINPSPYVSEWESNPSMATLTIINKKRSMDVDVRATLKKDGKEVSSVLSGDISRINGPTNPNSPQVTTVFMSKQIAKWSEFKFIGEIKQFAERTGLLPEGNYEVCIEIVQTDAKQSESVSKLDLCSQIIVPSLPNPPELVLPLHNSEIDKSNLLFKWTTVIDSKDVVYKMKMVEISGNQSPQEAMNSNIVFYETNLNVPSLIFPLSTKKLTINSKYAWQIQAVDKDGNPVTLNNGKSKIYVYKFMGDLVSVMDTTLTNDTTPFQSLPDTLIANSFRIVVESWDVTSKSINQLLPSGIGKVRFDCNEDESNFGKYWNGDFSGIRVAFRDVKWAGATTPTVVLTEGLAYYSPTSSSETQEINIGSGFKLQIDSLLVTPNESKVKGSVILPSNIISDSSCTYSKLNLPLTSINTECEFYSNVTNGDFGRFYIGETDILIEGHNGYVLDFSSSQSPLAKQSASWKGILLKEGETPDESGDMLINNRGYVKAKYTFTNGLITSNGFSARLVLARSFTYKSLEPFGYEIILSASVSSFLRLSSSSIEEGEFADARVIFPEKSALLVNNSRIETDPFTLKVEPDMDLSGRIKVNGSITWGEFSGYTGGKKFYQLDNIGADTDSNGYFYLGARYLNPYYPIEGGEFSSPTTLELETKEIQGATLLISHKKFTIWTKDLPDTTIGLVFEDINVYGTWLNFIRTGVHSEIRLYQTPPLYQNPEKQIGPTWFDKYQGKVPFKISFKIYDASPWGDDTSYMKIQFVESAVWDSDLKGNIILNLPINDTLHFKEMIFTSTADNAGGKLDLNTPIDMEYWGVQLVPTGLSNSNGIVSGKLGVIYTTAAGINEPVHFTNPFYMTWGEIKPDGNLGRLFPDYHNSGQQFDGFYYSASLLRLSDYVLSDTGCVITYGAVSINFFGSKKMSIFDYNCEHTPTHFNGRFVSVRPDLVGENELHWEKSWAGGLANLVFNISYDSLSQDGFIGIGTVEMPGKLTGFMLAKIDVKSQGSCFSVYLDIGSQIDFGIAAHFGGIASLWGCGCIKGEVLEQIVLGGELSTTAGNSLHAREGSSVSVIMSYRPTQSIFEFNGQMFISLLSSLDVEVTGLALLTFDYDNLYIDGYLKGYFTSSAVLSGTSVEGELDWHFGDYQSIQGRVAATGSGFALWVQGGANIEAGFFVGVLAPKQSAWIMNGIDGRFGFNMDLIAGDSSITGGYFYISATATAGLVMYSLGIQTYLGTGVFYFSQIPGVPPTVIGNLGIRMWGEILGGLISVSGTANFQISTTPPDCQGSIELCGCTRFLGCKCITYACRFNFQDGLQIY